MQQAAGVHSMRISSLQVLLGRLIWLSMLPLLALGVYLVVLHVENLRQDTELNAQQRANNAATLIDNFVEAQIAGLKTLAHSPLLNEPLRLAEFYEVAQGFRETLGMHVIVADSAMRMKLNTRVPFGEALPSLPVPRKGGRAAVPLALSSGKPAVGDIVDGPIVHQPLVVVAVPVLREGRPPHVLISTMEVRHIERQLQKVQLPAGWTLSLLDGKGETMAVHPPRSSGNTAVGNGDILRVPVAASGGRWQVLLEIDQDLHLAPLRKAVAALVAALLAAVIISYLIGRNVRLTIVRAISSLNVGEPELAPAPPRITEVEAIRTRLGEGAEALRASELRYRSLFHNQHAVMLLIEPADGRIVDANPAAERFYGWTREELLSRHIFEINMLDAAEVRAEMERAVQEKRGAFRFRHRRADGSIADVAVYSGPVEIDGRTLLYSIVHDETERVLAETALRESETRYEELFAANPQPMWFYDLETLRFLAVNAAAIQHYGYSEAEFLAMTIADIRPPEDVPRLHGNIARVKLADDAGPDRAGVWRHRRKDGDLIDVEIISHVLDYKGHRAEVVLANDVTERLRAEERVAEYVMRLERAMTGTAEAIAQIMDMRDPYTAGHERRVGEIAAAIAWEMGLSESVQRGLRVAGDLHDLGKITVPVEILAKPGKLSVNEFELIKQHPQKGYEVLKGIDFPWPVAEVAYQHHERIDGSGYPRGLKGDEILLEARILAVADVVEAMSSHRPYRAGLGIDKALAEIEAHAGRQYDAAVVAACLRMFRQNGYRMPA